MGDIDRLESYLRAAAVSRRERGAAGARPFVTISRQAGAGGRTLAEALLREMERDGRPLFRGWRLFHSELCELVARDPELSVSLEELLDERYRGQLEDYFASMLGTRSPQATVIRKLFRLIRALAAEGKAVIVGRAGASVTRPLPGGVHVRLVASEPARRSAIMHRYKLDRRAAERRMRELDDSRRRLVRGYFHREVDDPLLYDVTLNMDELSPQSAARVLLALVAERAKGRT